VYLKIDLKFQISMVSILLVKLNHAFMSKIFAAIIMIIDLCCAWSATVFAHVPHAVVTYLKLSLSFLHAKTIYRGTD
jgi:hypothetical protein